MKKKKFVEITVYYWHLTKLKNMTIDHKAHFWYSLKKRNEILNEVLNNGYSVMLRPMGDNLCIWIDDGKFSQS